MTTRFKDAVKDVVLDGEITAPERAHLNRIIAEDNISEIDAETYIIKKQKEQKLKLKKESEEKWYIKNAPALITGAIGIGTLVLKSVLENNNK